MEQHDRQQRYQGEERRRQSQSDYKGEERRKPEPTRESPTGDPQSQEPGLEARGQKKEEAQKGKQG